MTKEAITPFNIEDQIQSAEDAIEFIIGAFEELPPEQAIRVLQSAAKYKGMTELAERTGLSRAGLYKALGKNGDPKLSTLSQVLAAFGLRISVTPMEDGQAA